MHLCDLKQNTTAAQSNTLPFHHWIFTDSCMVCRSAAAHMPLGTACFGLQEHGTYRKVLLHYIDSQTESHYLVLLWISDTVHSCTTEKPVVTLTGNLSSVKQTSEIKSAHLSRSPLNYSPILVQIVCEAKNGALPLGMQDGRSLTQYCTALKWDALFRCTICRRYTGVTQFSDMMREAVRHRVWQGAGRLVHRTLSCLFLGMWFRRESFRLSVPCAVLCLSSRCRVCCTLQ